MVVQDVEFSASPIFRIASWLVLVVTIGVIITGDIVQATRSGAGCGQSWPRCDGSLFPAFEDAETGIEFVHRAATFALSLLILGLYLGARRMFAARHRIRAAMKYVLGLFVAEVSIGALLVLFGWVDDDASFGRVVADGLHVINTFFLLAGLALVVHYAAGGGWGYRVFLKGPSRRLLLGGALMLVIGITGAINSLADTLFAADPVLEGVRDAFGPAAPFLLRIRAIHSIVAIAGGSALFVLIRSLTSTARDSSYRLGRRLQAMIGAQFVLGVLNIALLTPLEVQVLHLLAADLLWVGFLLLLWRLCDSDAVALGHDEVGKEVAA